MRLRTVPVEVANGHGHTKEGELILLDGQKERRQLSEGKTPKVLSVDALLKGLVALLLTLLVGSQGWLFTQVIANSSRLTAVEAHIDEHTRQNTLILNELRQAHTLLRELLQRSAAVQAEIENLEDEVKKK